MYDLYAILCAMMLIIIFMCLCIHPPFELFTLDSHVSPWSIPLQKDMSEREITWDLDHSHELYYYYNSVPQKYKE